MSSMYGISVDLPAGWVDITEYAFEATGSPISKLLFTREELRPEEVDPWLEELREKVGALNLRAQPLVTYDHPSLRIRGFDAVSEAGGERAGTSFIVISFPDHAIVVQPHWLDGAEPLLRDLVRSFRTRSQQAPVAPLDPSKWGYAVYDLRFDSAIPFEQPWSFAFESADGRGRLWGTARPREAAFEPPLWNLRFEVDPSATMSESGHARRYVTSPHVLPPEATGAIFEEQRWVVTVSQPETSPQLTWAEARTLVNARPFRLWFAHEGDGEEATALWQALLLSAKRD